MYKGRKNQIRVGRSYDQMTRGMYRGRDGDTWLRGPHGGVGWTGP